MGGAAAASLSLFGPGGRKMRLLALASQVLGPTVRVEGDARCGLLSQPGLCASGWPGSLRLVWAHGREGGLARGCTCDWVRPVL